MKFDFEELFRKWERRFSRIQYLGELFCLQVMFVMLFGAILALDGVHLVARWRHSETLFWIITVVMAAFLVYGFVMACLDDPWERLPWRNRLFVAIGWIVECSLAYALFFFIGKGP